MERAMKNSLASIDLNRLAMRRYSRRDLLRYSAAAGLASIVLPAVAGCGGDDDSGTSTAKATTVQATLTDTSITLTPSTVSAGSVTFNVTNSGKVEHEFVTIKTDTAEDALPMDSNNDEADEAAAGPSPGEIEQVEPGATKSGTFDLTTGKYVIICNITGHYKMGMHTTLVVT